MIHHIKKIKFCFGFFLIATFNGALYPDNIIFDLDGVLGQKSNTAVYWELGLSKIFGIYNPFTIKSTMFDFLDLIEPRHANTPLAMHHNRLLPQIMCDWLSGTKSNQEILELINTAASKHSSFFSTKGQKSLVMAITTIMFTPERFIKSISVSSEGYKLFKQCYEERDGNHKRKHKLYILSNWDRESFALLSVTNKKLQKILKKCDGVIVSGQVGLIKPDSAIFEYLFNTYNIDPDNELTVYIDDEKINIQSAENLKKRKLVCIRCKDFNYKQVKKTLKDHGILS